MGRPFCTKCEEKGSGQRVFFGSREPEPDHDPFSRNFAVVSVKSTAIQDSV
jgi:hypothetical protein